MAGGNGELIGAIWRNSNRPPGGSLQGGGGIIDLWFGGIEGKNASPCDERGKSSASS